MTVPRILRPRSDRAAARARRALARAIASAPTQASREELLALQTRG